MGRTLRWNLHFFRGKILMLRRMGRDGLENLDFPPRFRVPQKFVGFYPLERDRAEVWAGVLAPDDRKKILRYLRERHRRPAWVDPRACFVTRPDTTVFAVLQNLGFYNVN